MTGGVTHHMLPHLSRVPPCKQALSDYYLKTSQRFIYELIYLFNYLHHMVRNTQHSGAPI